MTSKNKGVPDQPKTRKIYQKINGWEKVKCVLCGIEITKNRLKLHMMKTHSNNDKRTVGPCGGCGARFFDQSNLKTHIRLCRPLTKPKPTPEKTNEDNDVDRANQKISSHCEVQNVSESFQSKYPDDNKKCMACDITFARSKDLKKHLLKAKSCLASLQSQAVQKTTFWNRKYKFGCLTCGKKFQWNAELILHSRTHHTQSFKCDNQHSSTDCLLNNNLTTGNQEQQTSNDIKKTLSENLKPTVQITRFDFNCLPCGKSFTTKKHLRRHLLFAKSCKANIKSSVIPKQNTATKSTESEKKTEQYDEMVDTENKPSFECGECGKWLNTTMEINNHCLSHYSSNILPGPVESQQSSSQSTHIELTYTCLYKDCSHGWFNLEVDLWHHIETAHKIVDDLCCNLCGQDCDSKGSLFLHHQSAHDQVFIDVSAFKVEAPEVHFEEIYQDFIDTPPDMSGDQSSVSTPCQSIGPMNANGESVCRYCPEITFQNEYDLIIHILNQHQEPERYICEDMDCSNESTDNSHEPVQTHQHGIIEPSAENMESFNGDKPESTVSPESELQNNKPLIPESSFTLHTQSNHQVPDSLEPLLDISVKACQENFIADLELEKKQTQPEEIRPVKDPKEIPSVIQETEITVVDKTLNNHLCEDCEKLSQMFGPNGIQCKLKNRLIEPNHITKKVDTQTLISDPNELMPSSIEAESDTIEPVLISFDTSKSNSDYCCESLLQNYTENQEVEPERNIESDNQDQTTTQMSDQIILKSSEEAAVSTVDIDDTISVNSHPELVESSNCNANPTEVVQQDYISDEIMSETADFAVDSVSVAPVLFEKSNTQLVESSNTENQTEEEILQQHQIPDEIMSETADFAVVVVESSEKNQTQVEIVQQHQIPDEITSETADFAVVVVESSEENQTQVEIVQQHQIPDEITSETADFAVVVDISEENQTEEEVVQQQQISDEIISEPADFAVEAVSVAPFLFEKSTSELVECSDCNENQIEIVQDCISDDMIYDFSVLTVDTVNVAPFLFEASTPGNEEVDIVEPNVADMEPENEIGNNQKFPYQIFSNISGTTIYADNDELELDKTSFRKPVEDFYLFSQMWKKNESLNEIGPVIQSTINKEAENQIQEFPSEIPNNVVTEVYTVDAVGPEEQNQRRTEQAETTCIVKEANKSPESPKIRKRLDIKVPKVTSRNSNVTDASAKISLISIKKSARKSLETSKSKSEKSEKTKGTKTSSTPKVRRLYYTCHLCSSKFNYQENLYLHSKSHIVQQPFYFCTVCKLKPFKWQDMVIHAKAHPLEKAFGCLYCSESFMIDLELIDHTSINHSERKFPCPYCDKKYITDWELQCHVNFTHYE